MRNSDENKSSENQIAGVGATGFFLYATLIVMIQAIRDRSFWLDEATLMENLVQKTPGTIIFGGALSGTQQFPKIYLAVIDVVVRTFGYTTFWARVLPLGFGLAAFAVWLWLFYERYARHEIQWFPLIVSSGLLVVSSYTLGYAYEFKQYSAELFFCGALLALYQTKTLSPNRRLLLLNIVGVISLLFGYASILVAVVVSIITLLELTLWPKDKENRGIVVFGILSMVALLCFLYRVDYQYGFRGANGSTLHSYWTPQFVVGQTFIGKLKSLRQLYWHFLFDWWRTEWGNMNEHQAAVGAWYVWPWRTFRNPDIKNVLYILIACILGINAYRWFHLIRRRDVMGPSLLILMAMVLMAWMHIYPWGQSRLSLYGMPIVILLIVEALLLASAILQKLNVKPVWRSIVWIPFMWMIIRNGVFMLGGFTYARLGENINPAMKLIVPAESQYLAVAPLADQVLHTYSRLPRGIQLFYETEMQPVEMQKVIKNKPLYFVWTHNAPVCNAQGVPNGYERFYHRAETIYSGDSTYGPGLLLLKP